MKAKFLTILMATYFLTACGSDEKEGVKTVSYYQQNEKELSKKIKECKNNPGELMKTPNCINALQAVRKASSGGLSPSNWGDSL